MLVQTDVERDALLAHGLPREKLVLQGMGVDATACTGGDRQRIRAAWGVAPEEVVVGHLANNSVEKGTVDLLRTAEIAWNAGCRFRVVLAGPEMKNYRTFWENYRAKDYVTRLGVIDEALKRDFFAGIDLFALPSRSDSFGLVFLEAWANGVASIAYRAGGVPGVIRDGIDGALVRCGDVGALAETLRRLVEDTEVRRRMGEIGRARLSNEFRWQDKLELVRQVYRELTCLSVCERYNEPQASATPAARAKLSER